MTLYGFPCSRRDLLLTKLANEVVKSWPDLSGIIPFEKMTGSGEGIQGSIPNVARVAARHTNGDERRECQRLETYACVLASR